MTPDAHPRLVTLSKRFAGGSSIVAVLSGTVVLLGWRFGVPTLTALVPGARPMEPNAALGFVLAGLALWALIPEQTRTVSRTWTGRVLGAVVALLALLTLAEYALHVDLGIDQSFIPGMAGLAGSSPSDRMAPIVALNFLLVGVCVAGLDWKTAGGRLPARWLLLPVLLGSLLAIVSQTYGVTASSRVGPSTGMAAPTSLSFLLLSLGIPLARPRQGVVALLLVNSDARRVARRLLPGLLLLPWAVGAVLARGQRQRLYSGEFSLAVMTVLSLGLLGALLWFTSTRLDRAEQRRRAGEQRMALQSELSRILAGNDPTKETASNMLRTVAETFGWSVGAHWALGPDGRRLELSELWAVPSLQQSEFVHLKRGTRWDLGTGLPGRAWQEGKPAWTPDVTEDPNSPQAASAGKSGLKAAIAFPLFGPRGPQGVLEFFGPEAMEPSRELLETLKSLGYQIGQFQEHARTATELTEARTALVRATQAQWHRSSSLNQAIRLTVHDIMSKSKRILETNPGASQRELAEATRTGGEELEGLVNDFLDLSRIDAGHLEVERAPFPLRDCLEHALELVAPQAAAKKLELTYFCDENVPAGILGDAHRLRKVLGSLLANGIHSTEQGEVTVHVTAAPRGEGEVELDFAIRDTGLGIPPERFPTLFDLVDPPGAPDPPRLAGTEFGLALSKRLCELMGGRVWVESETGKGSTFHVALPTRIAPLPPMAVGRYAVPELHGKRALVVDHNETSRRLLRLQLENWGLVARDTASSHQALQWVQHGDRYDFVLVDERIPGVDGRTLARELRRHPSTDAARILLLSALGQEEPSTGPTSEFHAIVSKPLRWSQLQATLGDLLRQRPPPRAVAPRPAPSRPAPRRTRTGRLRILLAEDNVVNQKVAQLMLGKIGLRAKIVANGREVLQELERDPYDLVLLDVEMPEMGGLEAARAICDRWPPEQRPKLVALTSGNAQADAETGRVAGLDGVLPKPIDVSRLAAVIEGIRPGSTQPAPTAKEVIEIRTRMPPPVGEGTAQPPAPTPPPAPPKRVRRKTIEPPVQPEPSPPVLPAAPPPAPRSLPAISEEVPAGPLDPKVVTRLRRDVGGDRAMADLIKSYVDESNQLLAELRGAVATLDSRVLERAAQGLKTSSAQFGATSLVDFCRRLEELGRGGNLDDAGTILQRVETAHRSVKRALQVEATKVSL